MDRDRSNNSNNEEAPLRAGVTAGSVAAVLGSLANLPLQAPTDTLFNAATVTGASLFIGLVAGLLWRSLSSNPRRPILFAASSVVTFALVAVTAFVFDTQVDRSASYVVPLALMVLLLVVGLTPLLAHKLTAAPAWFVAAALALAVGVGGALVTQGDAESGTLTFPSRSMVVDVRW